MFDTLEDLVKWIDNEIADDGTLPDVKHDALVEHVTTNEFPLVVFFDKVHNWCIALDEPGKTPFDCYWFRSGMFTPAEAKRVLLNTFQDHTNFRQIKRTGVA
jgi:hypothetical protein